MFGSKNKKNEPVTTPPPDGVVFHAMPPLYRGKTGIASVVTMPKDERKNEKEKKPVSPPAEVPKPAAPHVEQPPKIAPTSPIPLKRKSVRRKKMVFVGVAVITLLFIGGILFVVFRSRSAPVPPPDEATGVVTPTPPISREPLPKGEDRDHDTLTDAEETIFGTDILKPDSDQDGYSDGQEIANLYDPLKSTPEAPLASSPLVSRYANASFGYTLLYPTSWTIESADPEGRTIRFRYATGERIHVTVFPSDGKMSARDWYTNRFPDDDTIDAERLFFEHFEGVWAKSRTEVYITPTVGGAERANIYALQYEPEGSSTLNFVTTLTMMFQSFTVDGVTNDVPESPKQ